jgi:acetyl esterase/lipase
VKYSVLDMTDHVERAITFVKENADKYQVDGDSLGLMSTAAGVHTVCLAAVTATNQTAVKAAGVYFPPTDFRDKGAQNLYLQANNSAWEQIMKQALPGVSAVPASASAPEVDGGALDPRLKLPQVSPKAPPFLIIHGDVDPLVGRGNSNLFFTAMRNTGIATDTVVKRPGGEPGPTIQAEVKTLADWFDKQLTQ